MVVSISVSCGVDSGSFSSIPCTAAVVVMMILALPFAYFQRRSGGVGFRIFAGTMLGLAFFLLGRLFTNLGVLNDWSPLFSATFPLVFFICAAFALLWWLERR